MFLINFFRYLRGYVRFEAKGPFVERFLNLVARGSIPVWSGRKRGEVYTGQVAAKDYRRLRAHAKKAGVRLRILEKQGVPFHRIKYRKRTGMLVGLGVFLAFLLGMGQFIWRIEIDGNQRVDDASLLQALDSLKVRPGTFRRSIDVRECERRLLLLVPDLSWAALNIEGSAVHVKVSETVPPPKMIDPKTPCNVVAKEAGQIVAMNVFDGQALIKVGDTVVPGDMIVSGITQDGRGQSLYRHARAEVFAETRQVLEVSVPLAQTRYRPTGDSVTRRYLGIFGVELPVFLPLSIPFPYHVERDQAALTVFSVEIPLYRLRERYVLMEEIPVTLTESQAKQEALSRLELLKKTRLEGAEIQDQRITGALAGDAFVVRGEFDCRMDIALEREILLSSDETRADRKK